MGFERSMPSASSEEGNELGLTPEEKAFMDKPEVAAFMKKAKMSPIEMAKYRRWKELADEMGVDLAA